MSLLSDFKSKIGDVIKALELKEKAKQIAVSKIPGVGPAISAGMAVSNLAKPKQIETPSTVFEVGKFSPEAKVIDPKLTGSPIKVPTYQEQVQSGQIQAKQVGLPTYKQPTLTPKQTQQAQASLKPTASSIAQQTVQNQIDLQRQETQQLRAQKLEGFVDRGSALLQPVGYILNNAISLPFQTLEYLTLKGAKTVTKDRLQDAYAEEAKRQKNRILETIQGKGDIFTEYEEKAQDFLKARGVGIYGGEKANALDIAGLTILGTIPEAVSWLTFVGPSAVRKGIQDMKILSTERKAIESLKTSMGFSASDNITKEAVIKRTRQLNHMVHPDKGGTAEAFNQVQKNSKALLSEVEKAGGEIKRIGQYQILKNRINDVLSKDIKTLTKLEGTPYFGTKALLPEQVGTIPTKPFQPYKQPQAGLSIRDINAKPIGNYEEKPIQIVSTLINKMNVDPALTKIINAQLLKLPPGLREVVNAQVKLGIDLDKPVTKEMIEDAYQQMQSTIDAPKLSGVTDAKALLREKAKTAPIPPASDLNKSYGQTTDKLTESIRDYFRTQEMKATEQVAKAQEKSVEKVEASKTVKKPQKKEVVKKEVPVKKVEQKSVLPKKETKDIVVYRGGEKLDLSKVDDRFGISVSKDKKVAEEFGEVEKLFIDKNAKIWKLDPETQNRITEEDYGNITEIARKKGYDIVDLGKYSIGDEQEIRIINPKILKTKPPQTTKSTPAQSIVPKVPIKKVVPVIPVKKKALDFSAFDGINKKALEENKYYEGRLVPKKQSVQAIISLPNDIKKLNKQIFGISEEQRLIHKEQIQDIKKQIENNFEKFKISKDILSSALYETDRLSTIRKYNPEKEIWEGEYFYDPDKFFNRIEEQVEYANESFKRIEEYDKKEKIKIQKSLDELIPKLKMISKIEKNELIIPKKERKRTYNVVRYSGEGFENTDNIRNGTWYSVQGYEGYDYSDRNIWGSGVGGPKLTVEKITLNNPLLIKVPSNDIGSEASINVIEKYFSKNYRELIDIIQKNDKNEISLQILKALNIPSEQINKIMKSPDIDNVVMDIAISKGLVELGYDSIVVSSKSQDFSDLIGEAGLPHPSKEIFKLAPNLTQQPKSTLLEKLKKPQLSTTGKRIFLSPDKPIIKTPSEILPSKSPLLGRTQVQKKIKETQEKTIPEIKVTKTEKSLLLKKLKDIKSGAQVAKKVEQQVVKRQSDAYKRQIVRVEKKTRKEERTRIIELFTKKIADVNEIKQAITDYTKANISLSNRGKLLETVNKAKTKGDLAKAMLRVDSISRAETSKQIRETIKKLSIDVKNLPVDVKKKIDGFLSQFKFAGMKDETIQRLLKSKEWMEAGNNLPNRIKMKIEMLDKVNLESLPINKLEEIKSTLDVLVYQGKVKTRVKDSIQKLRLEATLKNLKAGSKNLDIEEKKRLPGRPSGEDWWQQKLTEMKNYAQSGDWQLTGMERFFNKLDGYRNYNGVNYQTFYNPVKHANDKILTDYTNEAIQMAKLEKALHLNIYDYEKIGEYAIKVQVNGIDKLRASGYTSKMISQIHLNDRQMRMYKFMREKLDQYHPKLNKAMEEQYNESLGFVENYFPFKVDFEETVPIADQVRSIYRRTSTEKGFAKHRTQSNAPVKINAGAIFDGYLRTAIHFLHMNEITTALGKIAGDVKYGEAVGKKAQQYVLNWIDLEARAGRATPRYRALNILRTNLAIGVLGFKPSTILIQTFAKFEGAMELRSYAFRYDKEFITKPEIRKFIINSSAEMRTRVGDDVGYTELSEYSRFKKLQKKSVWAIQRVDSLTAGSIWYGAYRKKLNKLGLQFDINSVNQQALDYADGVVRRTQASAMYKDMPPALTGEHRDLAKTMFTFQTFMLNRWNYIKEDIVRQNIATAQEIKLIEDPKTKKEMKNELVNRISTQLFFLVLSSIATEFFRRKVTKFYYGKEYEETLPKRIKNLFLDEIPVLSQINSMYEYNQVPFPLGSTLQMGVAGSYELFTGKNWKYKTDGSRLTGLIKTGTAVGQGFGIPGTSELSKWLRGPVPRIFKALQGKQNKNPYAR